MAASSAKFGRGVDVSKGCYGPTVSRRNLDAATSEAVGFKTGCVASWMAYFCYTFRSWLDSVGTAVGVQQKMMRHADVATTMNVYGKAMMDCKLEAHTKLLEYAKVGFCGVEGQQLIGLNN
jgi:integrase